MVWPLAINPGGTVSIATHTTMDAAGEYGAIIICATEAMTISHVGFRVNTAIGSPTADIRIETVDPATGLPTGTLWDTNTNVVSGTLTSTTFHLEALTASASINTGEIFAVVMAYASGTSIIQGRLGNVGIQAGLPYAVLHAGSAVKTPQTNYHVDLALGSSSTAFYNVRGIIPVQTVTNVQFADSDDDRRGLRFKVPFKCSCSGIQNYFGTAVGDFTAALYADAGGLLASTTFEGDATAAASSGGPFLPFSAVELAANTWYRAVIVPTSGTNTQVTTLTMPSADYSEAMPWGTNAHYTTYTLAGGWVDTATTAYPLISILIDKLDDGAGGAAGGSFTFS
jgi:hypothetical protein